LASFRLGPPVPVSLKLSGRHSTKHCIRLCHLSLPGSGPRAECKCPLRFALCGAAFRLDPGCCARAAKCGYGKVQVETRANGPLAARPGAACTGSPVELEGPGPLSGRPAAQCAGRPAPGWENLNERDGLTSALASAFSGPSTGPGAAWSATQRRDALRVRFVPQCVCVCIYIIAAPSRRSVWQAGSGRVLRASALSLRLGVRVPDWRMRMLPY
jgi:hypothetical protein